MAAKDYTTEDAIKQGKADAEANAKLDQVKGPEGSTTEEILKDAQETAELNHEVDVKNQEEVKDNSQTLTNDTSKSAKENTARSQLDPTGKDPISDAEVKASATNAGMNTGNKTAVTNEEAANRAANPGEAQEESPFNMANKEEHDKLEVPEKVVHANKHQDVEGDKEKLNIPRKSDNKDS